MDMLSNPVDFSAIAGGNQRAKTDAAHAQIKQAARAVDSAGKALSQPQREAAAREAAEDFEAMFLSQMLQPMFDTVPTDGPFGGGHAEGIYRNMMIEEMGKSIARQGGVGIADQVYGEILKLQESGR